MPEERREDRKAREHKSDDRNDDREHRKAREHKKVDSSSRDRDRDSRDRRDRDERRNRKGSRDDNHKSSRRESRDSREDEHAEPEEAVPKEQPASKVEDKPNEAGATTEDLQERITKMREARQKKKGEDSISSWVQKTRILEKQKKLQKPPIAKMIAEQDEDEEEEEPEDAYSSKELAGMKVRHGLDQVMQGGEVILTLKDSRIIVGDDINEDADELENVSIAEQKSRKDAYIASKKKNVYDEDRFQNDMNTATTTILPQYDDAIKDEGIVLDESGGISEEAKIEEIRRKLQGLQGATGKIDSLQKTATVAKDFYTADEMLQFKKPKDKKKKKIRKKEKLNLDAMEAEAIASGLGAGDLGSRDANVKPKQLQEEAEQMGREQAYNIAVEKAREASKALLKDDGDAMDEEDDFQRELRKNREEALKKRTVLAGPKGVLAHLASLKKEPEPMSVDGEERMIISETQEFCLSLQLDAALRRRTDTGDDDEDKKPAEDPMVEAEEDNQQGWMEEAPATNGKAEDNVPAEDELPIREVTVGRGLAATLQLLHEKGSLKNGTEWGGRNMDKKPSKLVGIVDDDDDGDILLDRRDEYGRAMTPKESFRRISHKFHGKGPGKTKQEKKMKQFEEEQKLKHMDPSSATEKMREIQAQTHTPYVVLSGQIKPGQTSDPRSGFATVEKESSVGGLTPMLGDKKVEKKRPPTGVMKPPQAKRRR